MENTNEYFSSINEVSKRLDVPAHTLRYWEKQYFVGKIESGKQRKTRILKIKSCGKSYTWNYQGIYGKGNCMKGENENEF